MRRSLLVLTDYGWQNNKKVNFCYDFLINLSNIGFEYSFLRRFVAEELEKSPKRPNLVSIKFNSLFVLKLVKAIIYSDNTYVLYFMTVKISLAGTRKTKEV